MRVHPDSYRDPSPVQSKASTGPSDSYRNGAYIWQRFTSYTNLVFKCRINKLSLSKVCKGEKSLHSLPRVAIALAEAQAMVLFFNA